MNRMQRLWRWLSGRGAVIGVPYLWLIVFFLVPFFIVANIAFAEMGAVHPNDLLTIQDGSVSFTLKFGHFALIAQDSLYWNAFARSLVYAAATALICLAIGYPFAYFMARSPGSVQPALLMLVMLPFWTSFLLRVYAWKGLLTSGGWAHDAIVGLGLDRPLLALQLIAAPGQLMNSPFSLVLGMVYTYLPFMILPLYGTLSKLDGRLLEAAQDLGASPWVAFWKVTVPLSKAGIIAGTMLVFIPCVGELVIPELLGGPETLMIGRVIWDEFFANNDWPMASAVALIMILLILVPLALFNKYQAEAQEAR
jgi:putrescine transport system permease protein